MDAKKVRNAGIVSVLSAALAIGVGVLSSMSVGAQSQPYVGNDKPDASHPIVQAVSGNILTLAIGPDSTRDIKIDGSTLVVKDGKFAGVSALKVGDKVQVNPSTYLPSGMGGGSERTGAGSSSNNGSATNSDPSENKSEQDLSGNSNTGQSNTGLPGTESAQPGSSPNNGSATNSDPSASKSEQGSSDGSGGSTSTSTTSGPGSEQATSGSSAASIIWVASQNEMLLNGSVNWAQGDTTVLKTPGVAYSEYVIHTNDNTTYQSANSAGAAPTAAKSADMEIGSAVFVLGTDGGSSNPGFFTAKAILVLPASGKLR